MCNLDLPEISELLKRVNDAGGKLLLTDGDLALMIEPGKNIERTLLEDVRQGKRALIQYLKEFAALSAEDNDIGVRAEGIMHDGVRYYFVTPIQQNWVDPEVDREYKNSNPIHGSRALSLYIKGPLNVGAFRKAIDYLVERHESLRSTFHKVDGIYMMKIHCMSVDHFQMTDSSDERCLTDFLHFKCHSFDPATGPLFFVRFYQSGDHDFRIAIKFHHSIFDGFSEDVMIRDLLGAYSAFCRNELPAAPELKYQYKDYLFSMLQFCEQNRYSHRKYWRELFAGLPDIPDLAGPGKERRKIQEKMALAVDFVLPEELTEKLNWLSTQTASTLFVVLQAVFRLFVMKKTGARDIIIGSDHFGRDYEGMEDQIGCYARTMYVRTALTEADSLTDVIRKVIQSNHDAHTYLAFTLYDAMMELLPAGEENILNYSRFIILFRDLSISNMNNATPADESLASIDVEVTVQNSVVDSVLTVDILLKFKRFPNRMELELLYDTTLYSEEYIKNLVNEFWEFIFEG